MSLSHFDEKSGVIYSNTDWGRWWQTVGEISIEVNLEAETRAKNVQVTVRPNHIECKVFQKVIFQGPLCRTVVADETVWTIEEKKLLRIQLTKSDVATESPWPSLLKDQFQADPWTYHQMQKKFDLEKFQIEHPGFDFSNAELSKNYEKF